VDPIEGQVALEGKEALAVVADRTGFYHCLPICIHAFHFGHVQICFRPAFICDKIWRRAQFRLWTVLMATRVGHVICSYWNCCKVMYRRNVRVNV
jgi:hypothetical protein